MPEPTIPPAPLVSMQLPDGRYVPAPRIKATWEYTWREWLRSIFKPGYLSTTYEPYVPPPEDAR